VGAVEGPDHHEMREALNVGEPEFEFRQDAEDAFCVVLCAKALRNDGFFFVWTVYKSNRLRCKHSTLCLHVHPKRKRKPGECIRHLLCRISLASWLDEPSRQAPHECPAE
jgi:hypothetical protein